MNNLADSKLKGDAQFWRQINIRKTVCSNFRSNVTVHNGKKILHLNISDELSIINKLSICLLMKDNINNLAYINSIGTIKVYFRINFEGKSLQAYSFVTDIIPTS